MFPIGGGRAATYTVHHFIATTRQGMASTPVIGGYDRKDGGRRPIHVRRRRELFSRTI
jgi:hypothetical protein